MTDEPIITESQVSDLMTREYLVAVVRGQIEPIRQSGKGVFLKRGDETFRLGFRTSYEAGRFFQAALDVVAVINGSRAQFARAATNEEIEAIKEGRSLIQICYFCKHPKGYHYDESIRGVTQLPCNFTWEEDGKPVSCLCYGWCETKEEADKLAAEGNDG